MMKWFRHKPNIHPIKVRRLQNQLHRDLGQKFAADLHSLICRSADLMASGGMTADDIESTMSSAVADCLVYIEYMRGDPTFAISYVELAVERLKNKMHQTK